MKNDNRMIIIKSVATLVVHAISCAIIVPGVLKNVIDGVGVVVDDKDDIEESEIE